MWARFCQTKMAGHRGLTVLLAVLGALLLGARAQQPEVIKVGSNFTMEPKYTGNPSEINWKINGNKLVDMEVTPPSDPRFYRLQGRASIDRTNGSLTIRNLTLEDSGLYRAEVLLANSVYQYTEITLTVRACPLIPTITDQSTDDQIVLHCESSTPGVAYEWFYQTGSVGKSASYYERRSKKDVTLTCVVDNEVCNKSSSITIRYIPESNGLARGGNVGIIFGVIVVLAIAICVLLYLYRDKPCVVNRVQSVRKHFPCCKGNSTDVEEQPLSVDLQQGKMVGSEVTLEAQYIGNPSKITWKINDNKLVDMDLNTPDEPIFYHLQDRATIDRTNGRLTIKKLTLEDSGIYRAEVLGNRGYQITKIRLTVRESCVCITVKFPEDQPKGKMNPCLTIHNVKPEDHEQYVLEVLQSDGEKHELDIKETDDLVIIRTEDDRITLTVPDTEKVTKITLKKGGVTLFQWKVSDLKLHTNNITLEPGFVTVKNADGRGSYKVEVHSANNRITNNTVQQEANNQGNESPTNRKALKDAEMVPLTENGHPENQPIGSVTFHPINMTNKITWKKDGQPVTINGDRMISGPYGDLTINKVTSDDKGKYTVQCEDQKLGQEFILL